MIPTPDFTLIDSLEPLVTHFGFWRAPRIKPTAKIRSANPQKTICRVLWTCAGHVYGSVLSMPISLSGLLTKFRGFCFSTSASYLVESWYLLHPFRWNASSLFESAYFNILMTKGNLTTSLAWAYVTNSCVLLKAFLFLLGLSSSSSSLRSCIDPSNVNRIFNLILALQLFFLFFEASLKISFGSQRAVSLPAFFLQAACSYSNPADCYQLVS